MAPLVHLADLFVHEVGIGREKYSIASSIVVVHELLGIPDRWQQDLDALSGSITSDVTR